MRDAAAATSAGATLFEEATEGEEVERKDKLKSKNGAAASDAADIGASGGWSGGWASE